MENIIVSIIVPVYNVEPYLQQCLKSLVMQSLKEKEIIVVNDGSTDNSMDIINIYKRKYDFIKVIDKVNGGLSDARNTAIKVARGEFLAFVDGDDYIELDMMTEMTNYAERNKLDIVLCNYEKVYEDKSKNMKNGIKLDSSKIYSRDEIMKEFLNDIVPPHACDKIYRKNLFINNNIEFPKGLLHEDLLTTFNLFLKSSKVGYVNKDFYKYRTRDNSITTNLKLENIISMKTILNKINEVFQNDLEICRKFEDSLCEFNITNFNICVYINSNLKSNEAKKIIGDLHESLNVRLAYKNEYVKKLEKFKYLLYKCKVIDMFWKVKYKIKNCK